METVLKDVLNTRIQLPDTTYELLDRRGKTIHNCQREFSDMAEKALAAKRTVEKEENRFKPMMASGTPKTND